MYEVSVDKNETVDLSNLIESVTNGEEITFTRNNLPIAKLIGLPKEKPLPVFGSAKGLFTMADDFDSPLEDFAEYRR